MNAPLTLILSLSKDVVPGQSYFDKLSTSGDKE